MFGPKKFDVSTDRSLVDVGYRLLDAAMILTATAVGMSHTDAHYLENLLVVGATTVLMHLVAVEVAGTLLLVALVGTVAIVAQIRKPGGPPDG